MAPLDSLRKASGCVVVLLSLHAMLLAWIDWQTSPNLMEAAHMVAGLYSWHTFRFDVYRVNPPLVRAIATIPVIVSGPKYDFSEYSSTLQDRRECSLGCRFIMANHPDNVRWYFAMARWTCIPLCLLGGYMCYCLAREIYGRLSGLCALTLWCFSPMLLGCGATICPEVAAAGMGITAIYVFRRWLLKPDWQRVLTAGILLGVLSLMKLTWIIALGIWPILWLIWRCWPSPPVKGISVRSPGIRQLGVILILALCVINLGYGLEGSFRPFGDYQFISRTLGGTVCSRTNGLPVTANRFASSWMGRIPVPLPANLVQGVDTQRYDFERGLPSYFRGEWADHGWWCYYLYALAIKEPLGTWCLVALAIGVTIFGHGYSASWRDEIVVLVPFFAILAFVSSQTGFSIHSRYVIPALPFLFVWISKVVRVFAPRVATPATNTVQPVLGLTPRGKGAKVDWLSASWRLCVSLFSIRTMRALVVIALVWSVASSLGIYPHSLSYFNELAAILPTPTDASYPKLIGGQDKDRGLASRVGRALTAGPRNGPRHLLDSNIDWGQDLFYLKDWLIDHPGVKLDGLSYHGSYPVVLAGVSWDTPYPPPGPTNREKELEQQTVASIMGFAADQFGPQPGWYAVAVNYIYDYSGKHRYFLHFEPEAMAGYSIYIYHITLDEANRVRRELGLPELRGG